MKTFAASKNLKVEITEQFGAARGQFDIKRELLEALGCHAEGFFAAAEAE